MINPKTTSEQLLFSTVRLVASNGSTGTGFFFKFGFENNLSVPVIITNKHVVNNNQKENVKFYLHLKNGNAPDNEALSISFNTDWHFHQNQDLCFCFVNPLFEQIKTLKQKEIFYTSITENLIWEDKKLVDLNAIEEVIMVGYPGGLWDQGNNLPLFRRGITASHPAIDFNNKNVGAVDMACFPGSSGSPIFILNQGGYVDKENNFNIGKDRLIFLGILFQGPHYDVKGQLVIENIPTQQKVSSLTHMMMNLGYYIKAEEILAFKPEIENLIEKT